MEMLLGLVVILIVGLMLTLVLTSGGSILNPMGADSNSLRRPAYSYPERLPGPSPSHIVQGVNTSITGVSIHNEDEAIESALIGHRDFASTINPITLTNGADMIGYGGDNSRALKLAPAL
jgi:hypothetical protein